MATSFRSLSTAVYQQTTGRDTFKDPETRKTFLMDYYKHLNDTNEIILYCHHRNIGKVDNARIRSELTGAGSKLHHVRNPVYRAYLRNAEHEDPASKAAREQFIDNVHPLLPLLKGPTAIIAIPKADPAAVKQVLKILSTTNHKLFVIGARVDSLVYDVAKIDQFKDLPTKEQLQGQLAGLLTVLGGAGLVQTLQLAGTHLHLTLKTRVEDLEKEQ